MASAEKFISTLEKAVEEYAATNWPDFKEAAETDARTFVADWADSLTTWVDLVIEGKLSVDDFHSLVGGKIDLAELRCLKDAGLVVYQWDHFKSGLVGVIVHTAVTYFL